MLALVSPSDPLAGSQGLPHEGSGAGWATDVAGGECWREGASGPPACFLPQPCGILWYCYIVHLYC